MSFSIDEPAPLAMILFITDVSCAGANNGEIFADVGGGTAPYNYQWNPGGQSGDTAINLAPGSYTVVVSDQNLCTASSSSSISEPLPMSSLVISTDETCGGLCDGTALVQLGGGTQPYRFQWCDGDTSTTAENLCEGICWVDIRDGNNCLVRDTFQINGPDPLDVTLVHTDVSCAGCSDGTVMATVTGGVPPYSYLWTSLGQSSSSISGVPAGFYELCVTDSENCVKCETVEILDGTIAVKEISTFSSLYVFPNPLTDKTTFIFSTGMKQHVKLEILEMEGSIVSKLVDHEMTAGEHKVTLDASLLSSGVYFYRFISNERIQTGRLIISK
jgi:hypothetical protein